MGLGAKIEYLFLDPLPDDSGHFISIEINNWLVDLDLLEGLSEASFAKSELGNHYWDGNKIY